VIGFSYPLSPEAIREAYFLGIGDSAKRAEVFAKYTRTFPTPTSGPYVSTIEFETPYIAVADRIAQSPADYHAPDAEKEFLGKPTNCHVIVQVGFPYNEYDNVTVQLLQNGKEIDAQSKHATFLYSGGDAPAPVGIQKDVEYPAEKIDPDQLATVQVAVKNGPTVSTTFDLSHLRFTRRWGCTPELSRLTEAFSPTGPPQISSLGRGNIGQLAMTMHVRFPLASSVRVASARHRRGCLTGKIAYQ